MLFSSLSFMVVFLPCVLIIYYILLRNHRNFQNYFLLLASLAFYAWGEPLFVLVIMLSVLGNWIFGMLVDKHRENRKKARGIIVLMLIFNLSIIYIFKYLVFTLKNINSLMGTDIGIPEIALPIGISFFTFQAISYVIDIYKERGELQKNLLNVGLYIAFFPQLVAGPIIRYASISDQIMNRKESWEKFSQGTCRFITGLAKKVLLANNFAVIADQSFACAANDNCSIAFAWLGAIAYTLQIYFDFSGYSDMAIGLGRMFGFRFPENFNYPYISRSISEFWRRWHMSLGLWFRDYVYFPLGGSRVDSKFRLALNLFIVWLLTGVWHGANWTFICWGLLYFVLLTFEKFTGFEKNSLSAPVKHFYTMLLVILGWVLFRAVSLENAVAYLAIMFGLAGQPLTDANFFVYLSENIYYLIFGIIFSTPITKTLSAFVSSRSREENPAVVIVYCTLFIAGLLFSMSYLVKGAYNPFIYFNF